MSDPAYPSLPHCKPVFKTAKLILLAGLWLSLSACERNEPVPDPAPEPPAPRTLNDTLTPSLQQAIFRFPASQPAGNSVDELGPWRLRLPRT